MQAALRVAVPCSNATLLRWRKAWSEEKKRRGKKKEKKEKKGKEKKERERKKEKNVGKRKMDYLTF
jgi:hypothetical protein